jgi:hypothetical protein
MNQSTIKLDHHPNQEINHTTTHRTDTNRYQANNIDKRGSAGSPNRSKMTAIIDKQQRHEAQPRHTAHTAENKEKVLPIWLKTEGRVGSLL